MVYGVQRALKAAISLFSVGVALAGPLRSAAAQGAPSLVWMQAGSQPIGSVAYSPDGKTVALGGLGAVYLFNTSNGLLTHTLSFGVPIGTFEFTSLAFSPDGKTLGGGGVFLQGAVVGGAGGAAGLVTLSTGKLTIVPTAANSGAVYSVAFSPDSKTFAVGGVAAVTSGQTGVLELWTVATGKLATAVKTTATAVNSVAFSPDGKTLADGGSLVGLGLLETWAASNPTKATSFTTHAAYVASVGFTPDSKTLFAGGVLNALPSTAVVLEAWTAATANIVKRVVDTYSNDISAVVCSPDGKRLYSSQETAQGSAVAEWNPSTMAFMGAINVNFAVVSSLAVSPDSKGLLLAGWVPTNGGGGSSGGPGISPRPFPGYNAAGRAILCDATTGNVNRQLGDSLLEAGAVAFFPDGKTLAGAGMGTSATSSASPGMATPPGVALFSASSGTLTSQPTMGPQLSIPINSVAASHDGKTLAMVSGSYPEPGDLALWTVANPFGGPNGATYPPTGLAELMAVAYSPDGTLLADAGDSISGGGVEIWAVSKSTPPMQLLSGAFIVNAIAFSPDGKTLAVGGNGVDGGVLELWTVSTGILAASLPTGLGTVSTVAFSADSSKVAAAGAGGATTNPGSIEWWDAKKFTNLKTVASGTQNVNCLTYSNGGGFLFAGTEQSIQIYNTTNYGLTTTYGIETVGVNAIAMSPGGATFAYGRADGTVVLANNPNPAADIRVSVTMTPQTVKAGSQGTAVLTLSAPAPKGGMTCRLTTSNSRVASLSSSTVLFPEGVSTVKVNVTTHPVPVRTIVEVTAHVAAGTHTTKLVVAP
jgi:WD40 repeat protein